MNVEEFKRREVSRRQFLGSSAQRAAGMAVGVVGLGSSVASTVAAGSIQDSHSALSRIGLGIIGIRNRGRVLGDEFAKLPSVEVRSLCDVDESLFAPALRVITELSGNTPRASTIFDGCSTILRSMLLSLRPPIIGTFQ